MVLDKFKAFWAEKLLYYQTTAKIVLNIQWSLFI